MCNLRTHWLVGFQNSLTADEVKDIIQAVILKAAEEENPYSMDNMKYFIEFVMDELLEKLHTLQRNYKYVCKLMPLLLV